MDLAPSQKRRIFRQELWSVMHEGKGRAGQAFNFFLTILILISVAIIPLEFLPGYEEYYGALNIIEAVVVGLFTVEYLLRIYSAPKRLRYMISFFGIVDLLSIVPFYTGIFRTEYIRAFRFIRFFKIAEIDSAAQKDAVSTMKKGIGLIDGESVEYIVSKSPIILIFGVIPPLVTLTFGFGILFAFAGYASVSVAVVLFVFAFVFLWKAWLDYSYDVIYVTNFRLIFQNQHILGRSINQIPYSSITNIKPYYPNPWSYVLRYGSLVIDTAAEHPGQIGLHTVRNHEHAAHVIMQKCFAQGGSAMVG